MTAQTRAFEQGREKGRMDAMEEISAAIDESNAALKRRVLAAMEKLDDDLAGGVAFVDFQPIRDIVEAKEKP